ncbi:cell wall hydrolase [Rhizobium calliandrae]|uniref:Cell wall hydrolase n=1 Tax=Rhizobium calliandrae TaxID=1312182 RepID=A0ABT7KNL3_9HYPH|nr:cell wall hydrolase [Rhizobium calliandrae]MDL2410218.1 cell wall hydrolase [Rhizobium calliandrae]
MRAQRALGTCLSGLIFVGLAATGCTTVAKAPLASRNSSKSVRPTKVTYNYTAKDRDCLKRAMYFESEHSDHDGYMAVGSVVMNRLTSGAYASSICGVVAQKRQFAPGVMTRTVSDLAEPDLEQAASEVLSGERHPDVKDAMFFHTEGLKFPYNNIHYVTVAGGNAFYEKRGLDGALETPAPLPAFEVAMNYVTTNTVTTNAVTTTPSPILLPTGDQIPVPTLDPTTTASISAVPTSTVAVPAPKPLVDGAAVQPVGFGRAGG